MAKRNKRNISGQEIERSLHEDFGISEFREHQKETIESILEGNDTISIMPTGYGKSLTYQLPARLLRPDLTVIISPLISLMDDQVDNIKGVNAVQIHSGHSKEQREFSMRRVREGDVDAVYVSPEAISSKTLTDALLKRDIGLMVIDEAHCITTWGHDFRPSYQFLPEARKMLGNPQVALFTATATPHTKEDMVRVMKLKNPKIIQGDIVRKNISFSVKYPKGRKEQELIDEIYNNLEKPGSIIIYTSTIADTEDLHARLSGMMQVSKYHGKMDPAEKTENQERFMEDKARVMVSTSAFGMGIDKQDVHTIIHYAIPGSLEQYIQESGRAGRDGKPSKAILFFHPADLRIQNRFIQESNPSALAIEGLYSYLYQKASKIGEYQGHGISFAQLKYFLGKIEDDWIKNREQNALGALIEMGFIQRQGDEITFPKGPTIEVPEELLREKRIRDQRRLDIMKLYASTAEDRTNVVKNYFLGATSDLVESTQDVRDTVRDSILKFVRDYKESKRTIGGILSGDDSEDKAHTEYYRKLPFLSNFSIGFELEDLVAEGLVNQLQIGTGNYYVLSRGGANYLERKGMSIGKTPTIKDNIHDFRNLDRVRGELLKWGDDLSIDYNRDYEDWLVCYKSFIENRFNIGNESYNGGNIILLHSGHSKPSYKGFGQVMNFFLGKKVIEPPPSKFSLEKKR